MIHNSLRRFYFPIERLNYWLFLILLVAIPASRQWVTYFIWIWVLSSLLNYRSISKLRIEDFRIVAILGSIMVLGIVSLIYTENINLGLSILQTQISLIALPLFMVISRVERFSINNTIIAYLIGNLILSIYLVVKIFFIDDVFDYINYDYSIKRILDWTHALTYLHYHHTYISMHLCLGIVLSIFLYTKSENHRVKKFFLILTSGILLSTLILVGARSAMVVIFLFIIYYSIILLKRKRVFLGISLLILMIAFSTLVIMNSRLSRNLNNLKYRFIEEPAGNNLIYNGEFIKNSKNWGNISPDIITHEIIETNYGNALRVSCKEGSRYWPLVYNGRGIQYYSGVAYTFIFKYRVLKGSEIPFQVGWGAKDGENFANNIETRIDSLNNGWVECTAQYTFMEDHQNVITFINSMEPYSVVDFTDIELLVDDPLQRDSYVDQLEDIRVKVWRAAFHALKKSPVVGYGIGDVSETLSNIYLQQEIQEAYENRHNAHNQFLESGLQSGIPGVILLLTIIAILMKTMKYGGLGIIIIPFLIIIMINFLIESTLLRLNGVIFFSFWYSYFWLLLIKIKNR